MKLEWLLVAFFLPLFPFSIVFVHLFKKVSIPYIRAMLVIAWPLTGIYFLNHFNFTLSWLESWAIFTALFYAFRSLVVKEVSVWLSYLAVSTWSCLWLLPESQAFESLLTAALALSLPFVVLVFLSGELKQRFGAAYVGISSGIAETLPRLTRSLVFTILAIIATPVFPAFFILLKLVHSSLEADSLYAVLLISIWFFWSWSGIRLLQGIITGPYVADPDIQDLNLPKTMLYASLLFVIAILGIYMTGAI